MDISKDEQKYSNEQDLIMDQKSIEELMNMAQNTQKEQEELEEF